MGDQNGLGSEWLEATELFNDFITVCKNLPWFPNRLAVNIDFNPSMQPSMLAAEK